MTGTTHAATLYDPATGQPVAEVASVRLSADTGWAPRWSATCEVVGDRAQLDGLPEVIGVRLRRISGQGLSLADWTASYGGAVAAYPGSLAAITAALGGDPAADPPEQIDVRLILREVTYQPLTGTATLTLTSPEMRLQDVRRMMASSYTSPHTSLVQLALYVLSQVEPDLEIVLPAEDYTIQAGTVWEPGMTAWEVLAPHLTAADWGLFADTPTRYRLGPRTLAAAPSLTLAPPELVELEETTDPRQAITARMTYVTDPKGGGTSITIEGGVGFIPGDYHEYQRALPPGNGLAAHAISGHSRIGARERIATLTAAARYALRPDQMVALDLDPAAHGHVGQIEWAWPAGLMTLTLERYESEA